MLRRPSTVDSFRIVRERALEVHGPTGGKREAMRTRRTCRNSEKKVVLKKEQKQKKRVTWSCLIVAGCWPIAIQPEAVLDLGRTA